VAFTLCAAAQSAYAIAGLGFHWGFDFSLNMEDAKREPAVFEDLKLDLGETLTPYIVDTILFNASEASIFVERTGWKPRLVNFGGTLFIDIVPIVDAVELSYNLGTWEYVGKVIFPDTAWVAAQGPPDVKQRTQFGYDTTLLTISKSKNLAYMGIENTPYAKLQFDLTVRKTLLSIPPVTEICRVYAGGGPSVHFATPLLSGAFIDEVIGNSLSGTKTIDQLAADVFDNRELMQHIVEEMLHRLLTPHFGVHVIAGVIAQLPAIPLGVYIDGKLMIPLTAMDDHARLSALGFLMNAGIVLAY
jgi:hypothetical protein